jgi:hypothetical protein
MIRTTGIALAVLGTMVPPSPAGSAPRRFGEATPPLARAERIAPVSGPTPVASVGMADVHELIAAARGAPAALCALAANAVGNYWGGWSDAPATPLPRSEPQRRHRGERDAASPDDVRFLLESLATVVLWPGCLRNPEARRKDRHGVEGHSACRGIARSHRARGAPVQRFHRQLGRGGDHRVHRAAGNEELRYSQRWIYHGQPGLAAQRWCQPRRNHRIRRRSPWRPARRPSSAGHRGGGQPARLAIRD